MISRKTFLKQLTWAGLAVPFYQKLSNQNFLKIENNIFQKAVLANNIEIKRILLTNNQGIKKLKRSLGFDLANLAAGFVEKQSEYFRSEMVKTEMLKITTFLTSQQKPDGTLDFGNLASPPDTAFIIDPLCAAATICKNESMLSEIFHSLKSFIQKSCHQLAVGGVHTPNHRWVVSAALAKANALFPNETYTKRIDEWLAEVVFQDADGVYLERSITYAEVVNRSLIFISKYANKPELLEKVKKNLYWLYYCMEPNGDMVTVQSRRQDAFQRRNITEFYIHYRYMAIEENNAFFGAMASFIEKMPNYAEEVEKNLLYYFLENNVLQKEMPIGLLSTTYEKFYREISLVRKRNQDTSSYLFAGADWPIIIASGRSTNPNLFAFRKGKAILNFVRISTSFFSIGYIRGKGIEKTETGYRIYQQFEAPYYQPLPNEYKKSNGDYALSQSTDGRFWNKMDFEHRPQSNIQRLESEIIYEEKENKNFLHFKIKAPDGVKIVIELCFDENGTLKNCSPTEEFPNDFFLKSGYGQFSNGNDTITFGPALHQHEWTTELEGEMYSTHFGTLKTKGNYVYLTGICPFEYTLVIS